MRRRLMMYYASELKPFDMPLCSATAGTGEIITYWSEFSLILRQEWGYNATWGILWPTDSKPECESLLIKIEGLIDGDIVTFGLDIDRSQHFDKDGLYEINLNPEPEYNLNGNYWLTLYGNYTGTNCPVTVKFFTK